MTDIAIRGGRVLRPDHAVERADVLVDGDAGTVSEVAEEVGGADETLDAGGCLVLPGLVNAHTHAAMTLLRGYADDEPLDRWLRDHVWPVEAELTREDVAAGTRLALLEMIRSGTTAFVDMYFHVAAVAEAVADAGLRARVGHGVVTAGRDEAAATADVEESLRVADRFDGHADGRVRTTVAPHSLTTVGDAALRDLVAGARERGVPVHYHANETTDEVDPLVAEHGRRPLAHADDLGLCTPADFLAHGVHVDETEVELLADRGTGVVHCPASNMKLASGMAPVQAMLDAGVPVGLGTDGAASNNDLDMFDEMRDAAMVGKLAADDAAAMDADTVLRLATAGGAAVAGLPGGRVEVGAPADLAVVDFAAAHLTPDHDPVSHLVYAARGADVRHTVCDGRVLLADRACRTLDAAAVRGEAADRSRAAVERASDG